MTTLDSNDKREVVAALADLGDRYQPPPRWEARVWARVLRSELPKPPRSRWVLRIAVPAAAVVGMIAVSGVLGAALWRTHRELGLVQGAVEEEQGEIEQLRADLVEAKREARRAQVENARLHELATVREAECEAPMSLRKKQNSKLRPATGVACDANDPLCGL